MNNNVEAIFDELKSKFDKVIQDLQPPIEDSKLTTVIRGGTKWNTCWRTACYLSKHIYKEPPPPAGFHTQFLDEMNKVMEHWEEWDKNETQEKEELIDQDESGLVARLYRPKGYDPSSEKSACPPTLVFRGTDFEDMRDVAIAITMNFSLYEIDVGKMEFLFSLDKTIDPQKTREDLIDDDFVAIPIYSEKASILERLGINSSIISFDLTLTLEFLLKEHGDWLNNIQQGLGSGSKQYERARAYGKRFVETKILTSSDKRLELTGHSLGGGLASATCTVLSKLYPDISFHAIVFNPAGVHRNTIYPATISDGLIHAFAVKDEILTTLQNYRGDLPIIGAVFRLARPFIKQDGMPMVQGNFTRKLGISPGKYNEKWQVPAKGKRLPNLFPINSQTLIPPPKPDGFPEITRLDAMLSASSSLAHFVDQFIVDLNSRYRQSAEETISFWDKLTVTAVSNLLGPIGMLGGQTFIEIYLPYKEMIRQYWQDLKPELDALSKIIEASASYHGMDYVIAAYEHHQSKAS